MSTDIRFEDNQIVLEGPAVRVKGCDLLLDDPERRKREDGTKGEGLTRRALVHWNDELHLNFGGDYSAGVAIQGDVRLLDKAVCKHNLTCEQDILVNGTLVRDTSGGLLPTLEGAFAGGPQGPHIVDYKRKPIPGKQGGLGPTPHGSGHAAPVYTVRKLSVGEVLVELAEEILLLRKRVAELEKKP